MLREVREFPEGQRDPVRIVAQMLANIWFFLEIEYCYIKSERILYHLYISYSKRIDQFYIGHKNYLDDRFIRHNEGKSLAAKCGVPREMKFHTSFQTYGV